MNKQKVPKLFNHDLEDTKVPEPSADVAISKKAKEEIETRNAVLDCVGDSKFQGIQKKYDESKNQVVEKEMKLQILKRELAMLKA